MSVENPFEDDVPEEQAPQPEIQQPEQAKEGLLRRALEKTIQSTVNESSLPNGI